MNEIGATAQCKSWPNTCCQISTLAPRAEAYDSATVPTTTIPATGLRSINATMRKINASVLANSRVKSRLTSDCRSTLVAPTPAICTAVGVSFGRPPVTARGSRNSAAMVLTAAGRATSELVAAVDPSVSLVAPPLIWVELRITSSTGCTTRATTEQIGLAGQSGVDDIKP